MVLHFFLVNLLQFFVIAKSKEKTSNLHKKLSNLFDNSDIFIDMSSTLKSSLMSSYSFLIYFLFEPLLVEDDGKIIFNLQLLSVVHDIDAIHHDIDCNPPL